MSHARRRRAMVVSNQNDTSLKDKGQVVPHLWWRRDYDDTRPHHYSNSVDTTGGPQKSHDNPTSSDKIGRKHLLD